MSKRIFRKELTPLKSRNKAVREAREKIEGAMRRIKRKYPALVEALNYLEPAPVEEDIKGLCTDGKKLFFNPKDISERTSEGMLYFQILHIIFHGLLGHFEKGSAYDHRALSWDVMDLQVMRAFNESGISTSEAGCYGNIFYGFPDVRGMFEDESGFSLYYKASKNPVIQTDIKRRIKNIKRNVPLAGLDDHTTWALPRLELKIQPLPDAGDPGKGKGTDGWQQIVVSLAGKGLNGIAGFSAGDLEKAIARAVRSSGTKCWGQSAGGRCGEEVMAEDEALMDYRDLIKEAVSSMEICRESDEIDTALYEYGLDLYGDVPIIEPLEQKYESRISSVVIAVDTSGSCMNRLKDFWTETLEIFREISMQASIERLHYLECDTEICEEKEYCSVEELAATGNRTHSFKGYGGTSFIPVFGKIQEYVDTGEKIDFMVYFTDGEGDYPAEDPGYPVYFVFSDKEEVEFTDSYRPEWIRTMVLDGAAK